MASNLPIPDITGRPNVGAAFNDQAQATYGNRVSDIVSFLPTNLSSKYNSLVSQNVKDSLSNSDGKPSTDSQAAFTDTKSYEKFLSDTYAGTIKQLTAYKDAAKNGQQQNTDYDSIFNSVKTEQILSNAPTPTLDAATQQQFIAAATNNNFYIVQLQTALDELIRVNNARLNFGDKFYNPATGKASLTPDYRNGSVQSILSSAATILFQLVSVGALRPDDQLNIRPINLKDGGFQLTQDEIEFNNVAKQLKLPLKGAFTLNDRAPLVGKAYNTFTGVDTRVSYAMGYTVGTLEGLRTLTWSIHRGKSPAPMADQVPTVNRARGRRSISGTMIFAAFDEHPITSIYPMDMFPKDPDFQIDSAVRGDIIKPDQIPAFDLIVTLTNEYGYISVLSLFGVEIMDDGGGIGIDDLVNEEVIQYTAKDIDLLHKVNSKDGVVDPFDLRGLQSNSIFRRRSQILIGEDNVEAIQFYDTYYTSNFSPTTSKI